MLSTADFWTAFPLVLADEGFEEESAEEPEYEFPCEGFLGRECRKGADAEGVGDWHLGLGRCDCNVNMCPPCADWAIDQGLVRCDPAEPYDL